MHPTTTRTVTATAIVRTTALRIEKHEMIRVLHEEHAFADVFVSGGPPATTSSPFRSPPGSSRTGASCCTGGVDNPSEADGGLATLALLTDPAALAIDDAGNLYITERRLHRVRKVLAATGTISTIAGKWPRGPQPSC